jgi:hypothetical protein
MTGSKRQSVYKVERASREPEAASVPISNKFTHLPNEAQKSHSTQGASDIKSDATQRPGAELPALAQQLNIAGFLPAFSSYFYSNESRM